MSRAHQKRWSYITGERGRNRVRVFAHSTTGLLYLEYKQDGQKARTALSHRDREEGKRQADELALHLRRPEASLPHRLTLTELFDNYLREVTPAKGEQAQKHDHRVARTVLDILGPTRVVRTLTHRHAAQYISERRRRGDQRGRQKGSAPIGKRSLERDLAVLQAVLNWAVRADWLEKNPLKGFRTEREVSPRRPIVTADQYDALLKVAPFINPTFELALIVTYETGHRIGAVTQLRWSDIDLNARTICWPAATDKIGLEHDTPMRPELVAVLRRVRKARRISGDGWVLPSPVSPDEAASRHLMRDWWQRAQIRAGLPPEKGRGWHSLRRQFATEMKHTPLKDLCALGGWKDPQTVLKCYQRPDPVTMRKALAGRTRLAG